MIHESNILAAWSFLLGPSRLSVFTGADSPSSRLRARLGSGRAGTQLLLFGSEDWNDMYQISNDHVLKEEGGVTILGRSVNVSSREQKTRM